MGELNSRPAMLRKSKFGNVNALGLHCINPNARDNTCMIYENCIVKVKSINTHSVVGYEYVLEEKGFPISLFL